MTDTRHQRAKELFLEACEHDADSRAAFLDVACAGDSDLRAEIDEMLAIDSGSFLKTPLLQDSGELAKAFAGGEHSRAESSAGSPRSRAETFAAGDRSLAAGLHIPHYRVLRNLGEGGMGTVYEAEQENPRRIVALKVMRPALSGSSALRRFEFEGHLLGRLQHPGIAQIFEAGLADGAGGSRPYLVMELVRGSTLTEHARARKLGVADRVRLLAEICDAVEHAHQKGIIHRDLKPSNILVTEAGQPKVLDFGVARAVDAEVDAERTLEGQVVGTLAYMSPEQALGDPRGIDTRCDVYSLGVVLFELLCGRLPCDVSGRPLTEAARMIIEQKPERLGDVAPELKGDLETIAGKALEKDRDQRYMSVAALGADLRRYLRDEPIEARPPSTVYRLRKFVRRNRALTTAMVAAVLALVGGLVTSLILMTQSNRNAELARTNEGRALENEKIATARADDVMSLSALQDLDDLTADADLLWPPDPGLVPRYEAWLDRARKKVDELPAHEARLVALRAKAVPRTAEEAAASRASHPKLAELESTRRKLENFRKLFASPTSSRTGRETLPDPAIAGTDVNDVEPSERWNVAFDLNEQAWPLIEPGRTIFGREEEGLALARAAVDLTLPLAPPERASKYDTLAWALFANGRYEEALSAAEEARACVEPRRVRAFERYLADVRKAVEAMLGPDREAKQRALLTELESRVGALELEVASPTEWRFADTQDKWWHNQLTKLIAGLKAFADREDGLLSSGITPDHGWGVEKRLEFARTIEERSITGAEARARWSEAIASVRDTSQCPMYDGLVLEPELGVLPIGRDRESGLWEFVHLQSGEPPQRDAEGKLALRESMGIVLVLLPGGSFLMGAQRSDPSGPNYDPGAFAEEGPVHEIALSPFFLSKYEMTQGQWARLTGKHPSNHCATNQSVEWDARGVGWNELHPVEQVSWDEFQAELSHAGLLIPTEAQWEYACRAGTHTVYWCGDDKESLIGVDNLSDAYGKRHGNGNWTVWEEWLDDGQTSTAQVGVYRANPFGLHDLHGNVMEWCRDWFVEYGPKVQPGDGARLGKSFNRVLRGSCFQGTAGVGRSAAREDVQPTDAAPSLGVRPSRALTRR